MSKYIVTGCAGFIGSAVCRRLIANGHEIVGVDNMSSKASMSLAKWRQKVNFTFSAVDIADWSPLGVALQPHHGTIDGIIHLAAIPGVRKSIIQPDAYYRTNIIGTSNLLQLCGNWHIPYFFFASSSSVYGYNLNRMREDSPTDEPLSPYAATKKMGELLCYTYGQLYKFDVAIARYFTVYGPAGRPDMAPLRFIAKAIEGQTIEVYGDGEQRRDFTYIDDVVDATVTMLGLRGYNILNVGSGYPKNLWDLLDAIKSRYRVVTQPKCEELILHVRQMASYEGDVPSTYADNSLARKMLHWQPKVTLSKGIEKTIEWYLENRDEVKDALKEMIFDG